MGKFKMNSYMFFVNEKRKMNPEWRNKSNAELVPLCSPMWKMLSPEEKQVYEEMKRDYDATGEQRKKGEVRAGGYDTHGRSLAVIKRRDEEMKEDEQKKVEQVHKLVTEAMSENKLGNKIFFLLEVNVFCDDIPALAEDYLPPSKQTKKETIPAEISICKYSLEDGVKDEEIQHYFIKPGKFSTGFSFMVKKKIMESHKIDSEQEDDFYLDYTPDDKDNTPVDKDYTPDDKDYTPDDKGKEAAARRHYRSILQNILNFLDPSMNIDNLGLESRSKQILFTMPGSVSRCEKSLLWLYQKLFRNVEVDHIPMVILELPQLFHELAGASVSIQLSKASMANAAPQCAVNKSRYTVPTPVQKRTLPIVMAGMNSTDEGKGEMMKKVIPVSVAEDFLEKDTFKYVDGMSCDWHRENDAATDGCGGSDHCTTTAVRRWGFIMADHLCRKFNIKLIKGQHIPQESDNNPPDTEAGREWEALPGLSIRPPVASRGRSTNTDIRYRTEEKLPNTPMCLPNADRVLHSANTISDYLEDDVSTSDRSLDHYNGSIASGVTNFGVSVDKKEVGRPVIASKEKVFKQNALMAGLLENQKNGNVPTGSAK